MASVDGWLAGRLLCAVALALLGGCDAVADPADSNGDSEASGRGSDQAGSGGPVGLCTELERRASQAVRRVVEDADLSCMADVDCLIASEDTDCHATCGSLVSTATVSALRSAIDEQNDTTCREFAAAGCRLSIPPCSPPLEIACVDAHCRWLTTGEGSSGTQPRDAGTWPGDGDGDGDSGGRLDAGSAGGADAGADGGAPSGDCVAAELGFGPDGGFVAYLDSFELSPCDDFAAERSSFAIPGNDASCQSQVAGDASVTIADVNAALADADVQAALAAAPVLYGRDTRPADGQTYRIEVDGARIDVGSPCTAGTGCSTIPTGVDALRQLLQTLTTQQLAAPGCESFPAP
jgi:hypothetical protein